MKRVLISLSVSLNVLLLSFFLLSNSKPIKEINKQNYAQCDPCKSYENYPPFNYLDTTMLHAMANKYRTTIPSNVGGKMMVPQGKFNNVEDSKSIWFSLDSLKRFIWEVETNVCKNLCKNQTAPELGIRLYYARYPAPIKLASPFPQLLTLNPAYRNLHTIFMVPTYDDNGISRDFDPRLFNKSSCKPSAEFVTRMLVFAPSNTTAQNHGSLCPPLNCDGAAY